MLEIKIITSKDTLKVRQAVLRQGKSLNNCIFVGNDLITAKHFGMFFDKEIVGIISVFENKNANFTSENQLQIRGMAILEQHQKKGYGKLLMLECENHATIKKASLIWFNARETAVGFYKNLDYSIIETPFIIENIGVHYIMYKYLQ